MKKRLRNILILVVAGLSAGTGYAQQIPLNNQYLVNRYALSPAYAGHNNNVEVFTAYRKTWVGIPDAPEQKMVHINGAINDKMGVGGYFVSDQVGIFRSFSAMASYAYRLSINDMHHLQFGLSAGIFENYIELSGITSQDDLSDPTVIRNQGVNQKVFDATLGINYQFKGLHVGLVVPQLVGGKIRDKEEDNTVLYTLNQHYNFYANYSYNINQDFELSPFLLIRGSMNSPMHIEVAPKVSYKGFVWLAPAYRTNGDIAITAGGIPYKRLALSYSYEVSGSGMLGASSGNHEISIGLMIGGKKNRTTSVFGADPAINPEARKKPYLDWKKD